MSLSPKNAEILLSNIAVLLSFFADKECYNEAEDRVYICDLLSDAIGILTISGYRLNQLYIKPRELDNTQFNNFENVVGEADKIINKKIG